MIRAMSVLVAAIGLLLATITSALAADNVVHYFLTFSEESSMPLDDAAACIGYEGTIDEDRHYDIRVTEFVDGPQAGTIHLTGVVVGTFTITPDVGEVGTVYEGTYREKLTFTGTSFDDPRVSSFILPASATGTDGSRLRFLMHGHFVTDDTGQAKLEVFKFTCSQSPTS